MQRATLSGDRRGRCAKTGDSFFYFDAPGLLLFFLCARISLQTMSRGGTARADTQAFSENNIHTEKCTHSDQLAQGVACAEHLRRATCTDQLSRATCAVDLRRVTCAEHLRRATCADQLSKNTSTVQLAQCACESNLGKATLTERLRSATFRE